MSLQKRANSNGDNGALAATITTDNVKCFGESTSAINIMITNGKKPYNVYVDDRFVAENLAGGSLLVLNGYAVGMYKVRIEDRDGGFLEENKEVEYDNITSLLSISATPNATPLCFGENTGTIDITISGGRFKSNPTNYYQMLAISPGATKYQNEDVVSGKQ